MGRVSLQACVAVIGAGPAGLFAARELAQNGVSVVLFNRDIKPGGLAEYGIYPEKQKIKDGMRSQFWEILQIPGVKYYGNTPIGEKQPLSIQKIKQMGFAAVLVAVGAQGTKWLGLPGEDCRGVYHAKELVLHYNHLPPFSTQTFTIGKRVALIGVGNVMTDIVRYLCTLPQVEEMTSIARRGLAEIKFDRRELEHIIEHLDYADFQTEVERISPALTTIGQDPQSDVAIISEVYSNSTRSFTKPRWRLHFLLSTNKILCENGKVCGIRLEKNILEKTSNGTAARGTGEFIEIPIDTIIFAIGDAVDPEMGLPVKGTSYSITNAPHYPQSETSFELETSGSSAADIEGVFVCGWSRNASKGLVGIARRDGMNAARSILAYLKDHPVSNSIEISVLKASLNDAGYQFVTLEDLETLKAIEKENAQRSELSDFKFDTNEEMLRAIKKIV